MLETDEPRGITTVTRAPPEPWNGWKSEIANHASAVVVAIFAAAGSLTLACGAADGATAANAANGDAGIHRIKHVVIVMQENHSFDNYFGTYPGADGLPGLAGHPGAVPCVPDPDTHGCDRPYHDTHLTGDGGPHFQESAIADIDRGKMDGFIASAESTTPDTEKLGCIANAEPPVNGPAPIGDRCLDVMGYHTGAEIPNYWAYARRYVLMDHLFETNLGWSEPAHLFRTAYCGRKPAGC